MEPPCLAQCLGDYQPTKCGHDAPYREQITFDSLETKARWRECPRVYCMAAREGVHYQCLFVSLHSDSQSGDQSQGGDAKVPEPEVLPATTSAPTRKGGPCLENKRALTDYADALDKLWQR